MIEFEKFVKALTEAVARMDGLEARIEEQDAIIEELRYAGPADLRTAEDLAAFKDNWDDPMFENQFYDE